MSRDNDSLLSTLAAILHSPVCEQVKQKLNDEGISEETLLLLSDGDLKELGFKMGERRQILQHIERINASSVRPDDSFNVLAPIQEPMEVSATSSLSDTSSTFVSSIRSSTPITAHCNLRKFKNCPVNDILSHNRMTKGSVDGNLLVKSLQEGRLSSRQEFTFLIKVVGRYLMNNCAEQNRPKPQEKEDMALSIITVFPCLKDTSPNGYGSIFDRKSWTGALEHYVRNRRSHCADIDTLWTGKRQNSSLLATATVTIDATEATRSMREQRPTVANRQELLSLLDKTRSERRVWMSESHPSITEILLKYPRLKDVPDAVRQEFSAVVTCSKRLHTEWQHVKAAILQLSVPVASTSALLSCVEDDIDEDRRSEVAFKCVVHLLPAPPRKGVKKPRLSPDAAVGMFFQDIQDDSLESALCDLSNNGFVQPLLVRCNKQYFVKVDNSAINITDCSCFAEAVEFVFMCFFVFNVEYPNELRIFYAFLENLLGIEHSKKSSTLSGFLRSLRAAMSQQ